jgi:hypothetical protein
MPLPLQRHVANGSAATNRRSQNGTASQRQVLAQFSRKSADRKKRYISAGFAPQSEMEDFCGRAGFSYGRAIPSFCIRT